MAAFSQRTAALPYGIEISYADSGPVPGSTDYTTVILIHGSAFNGHGFEKLHRLAWKRNMRTVALQRREYPGSTRYTDIELDDLRNGRKAFTDGLAHLVASFVHYFVETQDIPQMSADGRSGGVAIVGWSLGTVTAMSLFADPEVIPSDLYTVLERYIKDLILYDPPYISFGYDLPPDSRVHNPWPKPSNGQTTEDLYRSFETWVSSYYNVPINWSGDINALDHRPRGDVATVDSWTYDQRARYFTMEAALRSEYAMYHEPMQTNLRNMTNWVLYKENVAQNFFPRVTVTYICAERSNWQCLWASYTAERRYCDHTNRGENIRPMKFVHLVHCNHFAHYDHPDDFLDALNEGIRTR